MIFQAENRLAASLAQCVVGWCTGCVEVVLRGSRTHTPDVLNWRSEREHLLLCEPFEDGNPVLGTKHFDLEYFVPQTELQS